jgi:hypothetical protein
MIGIFLPSIFPLSAISFFLNTRKKKDIAAIGAKELK